MPQPVANGLGGVGAARQARRITRPATGAPSLVNHHGTRPEVSYYHIKPHSYWPRQVSIARLSVRAVTFSPRMLGNDGRNRAAYFWEPLSAVTSNSISNTRAPGGNDGCPFVLVMNYRRKGISMKTTLVLAVLLAAAPAFAQTPDWRLGPNSRPNGATMQDYRLAPHPTARQRKPLHMQAVPTPKQAPSSKSQ
jgi:hypothetical protein